MDRGVSAVSVPRSFVSNVKKKYISHSGKNTYRMIAIHIRRQDVMVSMQRELGKL